MNLQLNSETIWLRLIQGYGGILVLTMVGEAFLVSLGGYPGPDAFFIGAISSLIAIAGLICAGYWIANGELSSERYQRISWWTLGSGAVFLGLNLAIMAATPPEGFLYVVSWIRWAVSLGSGVGLVIGIFEARAVERERIAERTRVRQQELQRQNELLDDFATIISHDIRNPLNVAKGRLELTQSETNNEHLEPVEKSLDRIESIINETLQLAREGRVVQEATVVDLESLVINCWSSVDTRSAKLNVEVLPTVEADPNRLQQIFENLFRNAIEHGGENVTIRVGPLEDGNGFYVEDDGPGIPEKQRETVFDVGFTTDRGGSRFGLGIVNRIVNAHDWQISVTTSNQGGARFEISGVEIVEQSPTMIPA